MTECERIINGFSREEWSLWIRRGGAIPNTSRPQALIEAINESVKSRRQNMEPTPKAIPTPTPAKSTSDLVAQREQFEVRLEALPSTTPGIIRLRNALKRLLRTYNLRCLRISPASTATQADPQEHQERQKLIA